jgi:hypothetical protein
MHFIVLKGDGKHRRIHSRPSVQGNSHPGVIGNRMEKRSEQFAGHRLKK